MSGQVVVVMEFCEGGSLASYLQEPDNMFGLPDTEFLLLLKHLGMYMYVIVCLVYLTEFLLLLKHLGMYMYVIVCLVYLTQSLFCSSNI